MHQNAPQKSSIKVLLVVFVLLLVLCVTVLQKSISRTSEKIVSALPKEIVSEVKYLFTQEREETLADVVSYAMKDAKGSYSIAIINLKTGESYYDKEHKKYNAASLYKLWVIAEAYRQIEKGKLQEEASVSAKIEDLNKEFGIASEGAELKEGTVQFTIESALRQMITISHNYAALLISDRVGLRNVSAFLKTYGFLESSLGSATTGPTTTAFDIAKFFEKLYKGELVNTESTNKIIYSLKKQQLNNKLPKYLPKDVVIAHKTGELGYVTHDAGIVYTKNGPYIIVVMSETKNPKAAEDRIGEISKVVYEYFSKKDMD